MFETHATSADNEARRASGWRDAPLSARGEEQARQLGARRRGEPFAAIHCSDLSRSFRTAELAFGGRGIPIVCDERLRECCFGKLDGAPAALVEAEKLERIDRPFPGGESYQQAVARVRSFLVELAARPVERVLIVGHRATQHGLEHVLCGRPLEELLREPFVWQPGWSYELSDQL